MNKIVMDYSIGHTDGVFLFNKKRKEDFWIFLGDLVGWGRLSLLTNRIKEAQEGAFEFVEILPTSAPPPSPILEIVPLYSFPLAMKIKARKDAEKATLTKE